MESIKGQEKVKDKLNEISTKIEEIKSKTLDDESMQSAFDELVDQMQRIRDQIQEKYDDMRASGKDNWEEFNSNIYQDLESFNEAFKKAGAIFRPPSRSYETKT